MSSESSGRGRCALVARFPRLALVPRARLGRFPSPVDVCDLAGGSRLYLKRDDLNAAEFGGNKVRALEFLLGGVERGDVVVTGGGYGSTHVLSTAAHAARLGAETIAVRWAHEPNESAQQVATQASERCARVIESATVAGGLSRLLLLRARLRFRGRSHYIPLGGRAPLGVLGHVGAALELAEQVQAGVLPAPACVVLPLGTGGTAAGLALGFAIAGLRTRVVAVRVVPRGAVGSWRVRWLAHRTHRLIERLAGERVAHRAPMNLEVRHDAYGGAYGRPLPEGERARRAILECSGIRLDSTYGAKAAAVALRLVADADSGPVLLWVTYSHGGSDTSPG